MTQRLVVIAVLSLTACGDGGLTALVPALEADASEVRFDDTYVGAERTASVSITSTGTAPVSIDAPRIIGDDVDAFRVSDAPDGLAAGAVMRLDVSFRPSAAGDATATLVVGSNADESPLEIELSGAGLAPLDCDDANQCTDDAFDPFAGVCTNTNRSGACDDGSACTSGDRCASGDCVGDAVTCVDTVSCTIDVCDPAVGCRFIPDVAQCDDGQPCTIDTCNPAATAGTGCTSAPAPDGTPCGTFTPCGTIELCASQLCIEVDIPDGIPCDDGDACTLADACLGTECVGTASDAPAALTGESFRYLTTFSVTPLGDGDHFIAVDRSLHVVSAALDEPVGTLSGAFFAKPVTRILEPSGGRVALTQSSEAVAVVDLGDVTAPSFVSEGTTGRSGNVFVGSDISRAYLCSGGALFGVAWADGAIAELGDVDDLCGGVAVLPLGSVAIEMFPIEAPMRVFALRDDGAHLAAELAPFLDDAGGFVVAADASAARFVATTGIAALSVVDVANPFAPTVTTLDLSVVPPDAALVDQLALVGDKLYLKDNANDAMLRLDIASAPTTLLDDWLVPTPPFASIAAVDAQQLFFRSATLMFTASAASSGVHSAQELLGGVGGVETLMSIGDGASVIGVSQAGFFRVEPGPSPTLTELAPNPGDALMPIVDGLRRGMFTAPTWRSSFGVTAGPLTADGDGRRGDERAAIVGGPIEEQDDFIVDESGGGLPLTFAQFDDARVLRAIALEGCTGVAVVEDDVGAQLVSISECAVDADITLTGYVVLALTPVDDIVSTTHHGTHVSVLGLTTAALISLTSFAPLEAQVPELDGALFASAGFDDARWLIVATYADGIRPARAVLFDTSSGFNAVRVSAFDVGEEAASASAPVDVARRVLGVVGNRAYVSDWDPLAVPTLGHRVAVFDLDAVPPVELDSFDVASEPVDMVVRPSDLVIGRVDGISIATPSCAE